jgi:hypothetical protein
MARHCICSDSVGQSLCSGIEGLTPCEVSLVSSVALILTHSLADFVVIG